MSKQKSQRNNKKKQRGRKGQSQSQRQRLQVVPRPKGDRLCAALWDWWQEGQLTQQQCAEALKVSLRTFQRWVDGQANDTPSPMARELVEQRLEDMGVDVPARA